MTTRTRSRRLLAALGAVALVAAACGDDDNGTQPSGPANPGLEGCVTDPNDCNSGTRGEGGQIIWLVNQGHDGVYSTLRPEGNSVYLTQMLEGLTPRLGYFQPDGTWVWDYDLLVDEPQVTSQNPQTIVYNLRPEAVWNDGTPISADDFGWFWYHQSGDETLCVGCNPSSTTGWEDVASVEGSNDGKTVTVTLKEGRLSPEWFAIFGPSFPAHYPGIDWSTPEGMGQTSEYFLNTVPTWSGGPFVVESWTPDERVIMVPNPQWYGEIASSLDTLVKEVVSDQGSWLPALENGELSGGAPASFTPDLVEQFESAANTYTALGSAGAVWEHVDVNMDSITDVALRKAIFTAIDRLDARGRIFGSLEPPLRNNHIFSQLSPYYQDLMSDRGYGSGDIEAARAILAEAGYTGYDTGDLVAPDGTEVPDVRLAFLASNTNRATFVELAQSYLADIGVTVVPAPTPPADLGTVLTSQDYDLVIFGWSGSPPMICPWFVTSPRRWR